MDWNGDRPMRIRLRITYATYDAEISGFAPDPSSAAFTVTDGFAKPWPVAWGRQSWGKHVESGSDASKIGQPAGPISIYVDRRGPGGIGGSQGYAVDLVGYLWY